MPIKVGDRLPDAKFRVMTTEGPVWKTTDEVFKGRKVALFAVPGAFTPTCHRNHMPGFVTNYDKIRAKGIDAVIVTAVNDVFVMNAWKRDTAPDGSVEFLADGNAEFAKAIDVTLSIGLAALGSADDTGATILKRADQALYRAKRDGRNRVVADAA